MTVGTPLRGDVMRYIWQHTNWLNFIYDLSGIQDILYNYIRDISSLQDLLEMKKYIMKRRQAKLFLMKCKDL